jgi:Lipocalin-like domain
VSGAVAYPLGPHPQGILVYDGRRVVAQLLDPDRPRFASGDRARGTDAEIRAAFVGSFAYYGTYEFSAARGRITHHVAGASFPNWVGTDLVREVRFEHDAAGRDRLILATPPMTVGGQRLATTLVWRRAP